MPRPTRPRNPSRPSTPRHVADPKRVPLERSYAQAVRRGLAGKTYMSDVQRAEYWARQQRMLAPQLEEQFSDNVAEISQGFPHEQTQFATANIELATLQSEPSPSQPSIDEQATAAGLGPGGIAPPPAR